MGGNCCKPDRRHKNTQDAHRQRQKLLAQLRHQQKVRAAKCIQAWWRSVLVQRTLLVAALSAWVIQCWWRTVLHRRLQQRRLKLLRLYVVEEQAVVKVQSWLRMCRCRQCYCQVCDTICVFQPPDDSTLPYPSHNLLQVQHRLISKQPRFHIEIVSV
ncbi:IQ domain-containing protein F3 [Ochotona princeps]|uniref:IQ domain-containing protein F3 n=1 Tax=Ochotona princeps TaxID=9978 RepID=UPI002714D2DC|nr:IQ domain-containing protein F3 [Ochotona princeps]